MKKMLNSNKAMVIPALVVIIIVAIGIVALTGGFNKGGYVRNWFAEDTGAQTGAVGAGAKTGASGTGQPDATVGLSTTSPQLDIRCVDIANPGINVGCGVSYIRNGVINYDSDGLDIDASPDDIIEFIANSTGWYGVHSSQTNVLAANKGVFTGGKYIVPYDENPEISVQMKDYATSISVQFFCEDDDELMTSSVTEAITDGDQPNIRTRITGDFEDYLQDAIYWCEYDATYFDSISTSLGSATEDIPEHFTFSNASSDKKKGAWLIGDIESSEVINFITVLDVDDSVSATAQNPICNLDDRGWYVDEDKGKFMYGSSDEDDEDIYQAYDNTSIYVTST